MSNDDKAVCERLLRYRKAIRADVDDLDLARSQPLIEQIKAGTRQLSRDTDILKSIETNGEKEQEVGLKPAMTQVWTPQRSQHWNERPSLRKWIRL